MPMILADTSVWIAYFRASDLRLVDHLRMLLEEERIAIAIPVKLELLSGCNREEWTRLRRVLSGLPLLIPEEKTWDRMEGWVEKAVSRGERFGVTDILIAALAADHNALLWSLDRDFERMQKLGFVRLYLNREDR
jgi:predicted nucleic acid-binding protein